MRGVKIRQLFLSRLGCSHTVLDTVLLSSLSQFPHRPALDLPDPLFGYVHRGSDFLQGQRFPAASQAKTPRDNLPLPLVEPVEKPFHVRLPQDLSRLLLVPAPRGSSVMLNVSEWLVRKRSR